MLELKKILQDGSIDVDLRMLVPLPDCAHVGKSLKASFANWYLQLQNERGNLDIKKKMREFLPKNDHVKNKDRQDPMAVLMLTKEDLAKYLTELGYVGHTLIPELDKFTENNKIGAFPHPISVAIGSFGKLFSMLGFQCKLLKTCNGYPSQSYPEICHSERK